MATGSSGSHAVTGARLRFCSFNVLAPSARICPPLDRQPWQEPFFNLKRMDDKDDSLVSGMWIKLLYMGIFAHDLLSILGCKMPLSSMEIEFAIVGYMLVYMPFVTNCLWINLLKRFVLYIHLSVYFLIPVIYQDIYTYFAGRLLQIRNLSRVITWSSIAAGSWGSNMLNLYQTVIWTLPWNSTILRSNCARSPQNFVWVTVSQWDDGKHFQISKITLHIPWVLIEKQNS